MSSPSTLLDIAELQSSDYALRGLRQTLKPIDQASQAKRTINGTLIDNSASQFRKYISTIACSDQLPPALDGVFPGDQVTVNCALEFSYVTAGGSPNRSVVSGSSRTEGAFTFYRPQLTMLILGFNKELDEWNRVVSWQLDLEEV